MYGGYSGILHVNVLHGTQVYITAIAENYAGLRSIFHSKPIIIDHTAPTIENVTTKYDVIVFNQEIDNETNIVVNELLFTTTWSVEDKENGVKSCFCSIGIVLDIVFYILCKKTKQILYMNMHFTFLF